MLKRYKCGKCSYISNRQDKLRNHKCESKMIELNQLTNAIKDARKLLYLTKDDRIKELANTFDWFHIADDGVVEIFMDHHMLSTFRTCEAKFQEEIINNWVPRAGNWSLSFGIAFHKWMEWFDEAETKSFTGEWSDGLEPKQISIFNWVERARKYWDENNLEQFKTEDGFKDLDGWQGAKLLLLQYWNEYGSGKERLRTVGSELGFGKDREVPILSDHTKFSYAPFRAFLTGRIDRIIDNGRVIGPLDRKTHRFFRGNEISKYKPNDAFVGYTLAIKTILGEKFKQQNKDCYGVIVDLVALKEPTDKTKNKYRFKRAYIDYDELYIEAFIQRQISTLAAIWQVLVEGRMPQWNTMACHNQYFKDCPYKTLHQDIHPGVIAGALNTFYQQREKRWSPYITQIEGTQQEQEEASQS